LDWTDIAIGAVIGFLLSIPANLLSTRIDRRLEKRSLISRKKKADELQRELDKVASFRANVVNLYLHLFIRVFISIGAITLMLIVFFIGLLFQNGLGILGSLLYTIAVFGGILFGYASFVGLTNDLLLISRYRDFDNYKSEIETRIKELTS
jgi:hypothetical protein